MSSGVTITLDTQGFTAMARELARMSGKSLSTVIRAQAAAVLKAAMRKTPMAKVAAIKAKHSASGNVKFPGGEVIAQWRGGTDTMFLEQSNFVPRPGSQSPRPVSGGRTWHNMTTGRRWSAARWARYQALEGIAAQTKAHQLKKKLGARGLAKGSWDQIARDLGVEIGTPNQAKRSIPSNRTTAIKNGSAQEVLAGAAFVIHLKNDQPTLTGKLQRPTGQQILQGAISSRLAAFRRDMQLGVFNDLRRRALRYPGIFVHQ